MKLQAKNNLTVLFIYVLFTFPLFYFVYKFGVLLGGYEDAKSYLKLFRDLNTNEVPCPFNMRLISPVLIHLLHKTGLFYSTECAIDAFPAVDKSYFFSNLLFNFICVTFTCFSLFISFSKLGFSKALSFLSGLVYLLGFGTVFYMLMPGVDALSILMFTWLWFFYLKKSYLVVPFFIAFVFQREYYFLVFLVVALMDYFQFSRQKYYIHVFLIAVICWTTYFLLRKFVFFTPHWHYQTSASNLLSILVGLKQDFFAMFRQTFMTMNLYFIYLLVLIYKKTRKHSISMYYFYMTLVLFLQITIVSIATTSGNNNGRYFYFITPMILYLMIKELSPLIKIELTQPQIN
jgi:hypothetical protein